MKGTPETPKDQKAPAHDTKQVWIQTESTLRKDVERAEMQQSMISNPNKPLETGITPLQYAASLGLNDLIRQLVASGANVNDRGTLGFTPAEVARRNGRKDSADTHDLLVRRKATPAIAFTHTPPKEGGPSPLTPSSSPPAVISSNQERPGASPPMLKESGGIPVPEHTAGSQAKVTGKRKIRDF